MLPIRGHIQKQYPVDYTAIDVIAGVNSKTVKAFNDNGDLVVIVDRVSTPNIQGVRILDYLQDTLEPLLLIKLREKIYKGELSELF